MQVRVSILATLAALAAVPALAQPQFTPMGAGSDCFRRAPAGNSDGYVWLTAPCSGQVSADLYPDGLAGGPPSLPPPAYRAPSLPPAPAYQASAAVDYAPGPPVNPPPSYVEPVSAPAVTASAYASAPPLAAYAPSRAPYYAGNIGNPPPAPISPPPALDDQAYLTASADLPPAYAPEPAYGPPPLADYGPDDCTISAGALAGGGYWQRQDCRGTEAGYTASPLPPSAPPAYAYDGYAAPSAYPPYPAPPEAGYRGYASSGGYAYDSASSARSDHAYGASSQAYAPYPGPSQGGYVSGGGYVYDRPPLALPGYAPGQCASSAGTAANGRVQYQAQNCERSSSQSYSYASGAAGGYVGSGPVQGGPQHWGVAGRDANGFLTWPGKVGF